MARIVEGAIVKYEAVYTDGRQEEMKKKKIVFVLLSFLLICGIGAGGVIFWMKQQTESEEEIVVQDNQSLIVAQISTINGNEITFAEAEEKDMSSPESGGAGTGQGMYGHEAGGEQNSSNADWASEKNQAPSVGSEDMSNGNMQRAPMPDTESQPENGTGKSQTESGNKRQGKKMYQVVGEEQTMLIPVGTTVTTQLGTTTTFSRLAAGDMVKILLEKDENGKDVIVGIWMVG